VGLYIVNFQVNLVPELKCGKIPDEGHEYTMDEVRSLN